MNWRSAGVVVHFLALGCAPSAHPAPPATRELASESIADKTLGIDASARAGDTPALDSFRWMEDATPRFTSWLDDQDHHATEVLDGVQGVGELRSRVSELRAGAGGGAEQVQVAAGRTFFLRRAESTESAALVVREPSGHEQILVDPNKRGTQSSHASISFAVPSVDGRYVAYGLAFGDSENATLYIFDVTSGRDLSEKIEGARYATPSWSPGHRSFVYTRVDGAGSTSAASPDKRTRVYLHQLGTNPAQDPAIFGHDVVDGVDFTEADRTYAYVDPTGPFYIGWVQHGTGPDVSIYVSRNDQSKLQWKEFASTSDKIGSFTVSQGSMFAVSRRDAPHARVVRKPLNSSDAAFDVLIPESEAFIKDVSASSSALYVFDELNGRGRSRVLANGSTSAPAEVKLPVAGPVSEIVTTPLSADALVAAESWTQATTWFRVDSHGGATDARLPAPTVSTFSGMIAEEVYVENGDVKVPLTIIRRKNARLDRSAPTLLFAYGAYGMNFGPYFAPAWLAWLERGGMFAVAHIRGGGERGESWHQDGMLANKQHSIDDFISCAHYLIENNYTSSEKLVAFSASAGGVVAGSAIVQRPELFVAAVLESALCNPLRLERLASGPQNAAEFGTTATAEGYRALLAIDPYMHVREGARYPRVLFSVGANDSRVPLWQSAKFAARLQSSAGESSRYLLRVYADEGHGVAAAASVRAHVIADEYTFAFLSTVGTIPKRAIDE